MHFGRLHFVNLAKDKSSDHDSDNCSEISAVTWFRIFSGLMKLLYFSSSLIHISYSMIHTQCGTLAYLVPFSKIFIMIRIQCGCDNDSQCVYDNDDTLCGRDNDDTQCGILAQSIGASSSLLPR